MVVGRWLARGGSTRTTMAVIPVFVPSRVAAATKWAATRSIDGSKVRTARSSSPSARKAASEPKT